MLRKKLRPQIKIMISASSDESAPSFSKGAAALLDQVKETGSLNKAAKNMHMAYSKAWTLLKRVEDTLGFKLIERNGVYGSCLSEKGEEFLELYKKFELEANEQVEMMFKTMFKSF
ncbi:MAG: LysR family transcriptional regulator [Coriobacteriales bacterium]|nr:LysR family transcriptional regulator [Coriobacteriales bacterium]